MFMYLFTDVFTKRQVVFIKNAPERALWHFDGEATNFVFHCFVHQCVATVLFYCF